MAKIAVIVGSISADSLNRKLAKGLIRLAPPDLACEFVEIAPLPHYNHDFDDDPPSEAVKTFRESIKASDGILFVTPEYNRSIPGVLKNALDTGSRPYGQSVWRGKPAGVIGITPGASGTAMAQQHLRNVLACLDMPTLGQPEAYIQAREGLFNPDGSIGEASREFLGKWMDAFAAWVRRLTV